MLGLLSSKNQLRREPGALRVGTPATTPRLPDLVGLASLVGLVVALSLIVRNLDPSIPANLATNARITTNGQLPESPSVAGLHDGVLWRIGAQTATAESPWILLDLGEPRTISRIAVYNCIEDCPNDSIPLIVEVGSSERDLRVVARKNIVFDRWVAEFPPKSYRFVRLRQLSEGSLALSEIDIR
jgi:hypothetical protein